MLRWNSSSEVELVSLCRKDQRENVRIILTNEPTKITSKYSGKCSENEKNENKNLSLKCEKVKTEATSTLLNVLPFTPNKFNL